MYFVSVKGKGICAICENLNKAKECLLDMASEPGTYYLTPGVMNGLVKAGDSDTSPFVVIVRASGDMDGSDSSDESVVKSPATKEKKEVMDDSDSGQDSSDSHSEVKKNKKDKGKKNKKNNKKKNKKSKDDDSESSSI